MAANGSPSDEVHTSDPNVRLRAMREDEWAAIRERTVSDYGDDIVRNQGLTREQAMAKANDSADSLLPDGVNTEGHRLFMAEMADSGERVGHLWYGPRSDPPDPTVAWVYDVFVDEQSRGRGIGRALMRLLEEHVRANGARRIELNVFGDNERARRLYASMGYVEMARQMGKDVSSSGPY